VRRRVAARRGWRAAAPAREDATLCADARCQRGTGIAALRDVTVDLIGWASSLVLFATLITQIHKQWQARDTEGVSPWLFIGQMAASIGFTTYSALIGNWIFVVTNVVLALAALTGLLVLKLHRKGARS
jgi:MtN3 and saliva related transmembrane protein